MRKYILLGLLIGIVPNICLGASIRYSQLIKEKQRKIEELEKCTGSTGKLKIAGISTLGLTAAGVAGNVVEAQKIKEYGKESEKLDKKLETARKEKAESETRLADQEVSKKCMESAEFKGAKHIKSMKKNDDDKCVIDSCVRNAKENEGGTDCTCDEGYKELGKQCVKKGEPKKSDTPAEKGLQGVDLKKTGTFSTDGVPTWEVEFDYGTVSGGAMCCGTAGNEYEQNTFSSTTTGSYCWCKVTGFTPTGTEEEQSGDNLSWVFLENITASCEKNCATKCAKKLAEDTEDKFRKALYREN